MGPHTDEGTCSLVPAGQELHKWVVDALDVRSQRTLLQHKTTVVFWSQQWMHAFGGVRVDCTCRTWLASCTDRWQRRY